jgi:hypothetical protein
MADSVERGGHYLDPFWRWYRGHIHLGRGDRAGAVEDGSTALELARATRDPQMVIPSLAFQSRLLLELGDDRAEPAALELVELCRGLELNIAHDWFLDIAVVLTALDRRAELETLAEWTSTPPTPWRDAGLAFGRGDPHEAAEILGRIGASAFEAEARLLAARAGLDAELSKAIEFFREVGATAYLAEAEDVLAKSRSA